MNKKIITSIIFMMSLIIFPQIVNAFVSPINNVEIKIKNLNTKNYIVDLFEYDITGKTFDSEINYKGDDLTDEQINQLHKLNIDGWISLSSRGSWDIDSSQCLGNENHINKFRVSESQSTYKVVIINNDTNEIKISKEFMIRDYETNINIDYNTMNIENKNIINILLMIVLTVGVELLIGYIFKMGNYKIVTCVCIVLNLFFGILLLKYKYHDFPFFIYGEIIIGLFIVKFILYKFIFKKMSNVNIISYILFTNIFAILISFWLVL